MFICMSIMILPLKTCVCMSVCLPFDLELEHLVQSQESQNISGWFLPFKRTNAKFAPSSLLEQDCLQVPASAAKFQNH